MKYQLTICLFFCLGLRASAQEEMVELSSLVPGIQYDLRYASRNNFTGVRLYPKHTRRAYLRKTPAIALAAAARELETAGLGIKVWDAYRPYSVTVKFWELIHDERYVANPAKGSGHNRGIAIDLTLVDLKTGRELDMPTGFDDFSAAAHHGHAHPDTNRVKNRELLRKTMEKHGFKSLETEWWHYAWPGSDAFEMLDVPIQQLKKGQPKQRHPH